MRWLRKIFSIRSLLPLLFLGLLSFPGQSAHSAEFTVYSVYQALNMGNPGEVAQKDYYINMGSANGVRVGTVLDVIRKVPSYDLVSQKLYKDVTFPIGQLKVIHVESTAAIARLVKLNPPENTPAVATRAILVGDLVRVSQ